MLVDKSYKEYLDLLSSDSPSPGGGSVSAASGGLAVSLMQMVCNLSLGKKDLQAYQDEIKGHLDASKEYKDFFIKSVDEDSEAFNLVIKAFRLAKETEEEKMARSQQIQLGYKHAAQVPFDVMKKAYDFLGHLEALVDITNQSAITDIHVSALQILACMEGAFANVTINLASIKDEDFVLEKKQAMEMMLKDAKGRIDELKNTIIERL